MSCVEGEISVRVQSHEFYETLNCRMHEDWSRLEATSRSIAGRARMHAINSESDSGCLTCFSWEHFRVQVRETLDNPKRVFAYFENPPSGSLVQWSVIEDHHCVVEMAVKILV